MKYTRWIGGVYATVIFLGFCFSAEATRYLDDEVEAVPIDVIWATRNGVKQIEGVNFASADLKRPQWQQLDKRFPDLRSLIVANSNFSDSDSPILPRDISDLQNNCGPYAPVTI